MKTHEARKGITLQFGLEFWEMYDAHRLYYANTPRDSFRRVFAIASLGFVLFFLLCRITTTVVYILATSNGVTYPWSITYPGSNTELIIGDRGWGDPTQLPEITTLPGLLNFAFFFAIAFVFWVDLLGLFRVWIVHKRNFQFYNRIITLTCDTAGIIYKDLHASSIIEWKFYNSFKENRRLFILLYGNDAYSIIPKRAFDSQSEIDAFREMMKNEINSRP